MVQADEVGPYIAIDVGSSTAKGELADERQYERGTDAHFENVMGYHKYLQHMQGCTIKDRYVGDDAMRMDGVLNLKRPIQSGIVKDWEEMEQIFHYMFFNELRVSPEEHPGVCLL